MQDDISVPIVRLQEALAELLSSRVLNGPDARGTGIRSSVRLRAMTENVIAATVQRARSEGVPWQAIGDELGVTRQAAFQRYGKPTDPRTGEPMNTTPLAEADKLAHEVISDLAAARWSQVVARFDDAMAKGLSEDALVAAWSQVVGQVGAFEGQDSPKVGRAADVTVTNTLLKFEAGEFVARIAFRDDKRIAGLFILKPEAV